MVSAGPAHENTLQEPPPEAQVDGAVEHIANQVDGAVEHIAKRPRRAAPGSAGDAGAMLPPKDVLICLVRGHVLRKGGMFCENLDGDWSDLHTVFKSIQRETAKILPKIRIGGGICKLVFVLDIVAKDADASTKKKIQKIIEKYVPLKAVRISSVALAPSQTETLLSTFAWCDDETSQLENVVGTFCFRADVELKHKIDLKTWVRRGLEEDQTVWPFKVWDEGGPADQLFFVPRTQREDFIRAVTRLSRYKPTSLQRIALHHIGDKKMLRGNLIFKAACKCNANSQKEWNPYYRIS